MESFYISSQMHIKYSILLTHRGQRSYNAERILGQNNFTVKNLEEAFALCSTMLPEKNEK